MTQLSNQPSKGMSDWMPDEFAVRKYIFDTWRKVCTQFGYQEYLTPILESAEIYRAKSGEDVGSKELMVLTDQGGRELAIRPEMTPSVTRLVSRVYESTPKPIRYFSIANFVRNEKPQRGRNREFWQLNFDIFGSESLNADVEVIQIAIEIMKSFGASQEHFQVHLNDRDLIQGTITQILKIDTEKTVQATRLLDKYRKIDREELVRELKALGAQPTDWDRFFAYMDHDVVTLHHYGENELKGNAGIARLESVWGTLAKLGYKDYFTLDPSMVRGFDYYDGVVFEVFDKNPENNRSLFGGGRYNGLAGIFGGKSFPAVGCAPGDETTKLFLESWGLLPKQLKSGPEVFIPMLEGIGFDIVSRLANTIRAEGKLVAVGLEEMKLQKALEYANKQQFAEILILGAEELEKGIYLRKDLKTGEQRECGLTS